jgi:hypothetical protein
VFCDHLDPARGELTPSQIRRLCERFVPLAPGWTARQLSRRLLAAIQAIDPEFHRRRYRRGLRERGVVLHLNRDGTATLVGEGLPPDEAAAAAARLDRLAEAARRAGHPGRLAQITADLFLGMLDGSFGGLTEAQILDRLLAHPRPEDGDGTDTTDADTDGGVARGDATDGSEPGGETADTTDSTDSTAVADTDSDPADTNPTGTAPAGTDPDPAGTGPTSAAATGEHGPVEPHPVGHSPVGPGTESAGAGADRWRGERIGIREGIELRVGLATLLGCDQRPAEIPGLGPIDAQLARLAVTRQRRGAEWQFAIVDTHGYLLLAGPLRRRPRTDRPKAAATGPPERVRGGTVELHLTLTELCRFAADPDLTGDWAGLVAEIADRWADRHRLWRELAKDPRARYARGALARHVRVRDCTCIGPCCDRSARRSDLDHTRDHGRGGHTVEANLGPGCWRHHPDKQRGWSLTQPQPGHFVWASPLGRTYRTQGEPVRPDLPEPDPPPEGTDQRDDPQNERGYRLDQNILWREGRNPEPPPPPAPDTEEEPPF